MSVPKLVRDSDGLALVLPGEKFKPLKIDFIKSWRQLKIGKQDIFARAIGVRLGWTHVIDATAGVGGDLLKLLKLGCTVTAIEESPLLFELLQDALQRADSNALWKAGAGTRVTLRHGRSEDFFPKEVKEKTVIYLDPMFPERQASALPKGEMQILSKLLGEPESVEPLWQKARAVLGARVVLKRPKDAPQELPPPIQSYAGKTVRYDVW